MKQVRKVLAPSDLSEFSKTGMRYALTLAKAVGADVIVYHAFDHQNFIDYESAIKDR